MVASSFAARYTISVALSLAVLCHFTAAKAFTYRSCSTDVYHPTEVPANAGTSEFERATSNAANYANNQFITWNVYFNPNVGLLWPRLKNVNTEACCDWLAMGSFYNYNQWSGSYADGYTGGGYYLGPSTSSQPNNVEMRWKTDVSLTLNSTPRVDSFALVCGTTSQPLVSWPRAMNQRTEGVLVDSNDVHYFTFYHQANTVMTVSLDVLAASTPNVDLDLYVSKTNQFPNDSSYDQIGYFGNLTSTIAGGGEFLFFGSGTRAGPIYVGVHSYSGAAHYALHASEFFSNSKTNYTVCHEGPLFSGYSYWQNYSTTLKQVSGRVAQYTMGGIWPLTWTGRTLAPGACADKVCSNISGCDIAIVPARFQDCGCCQSTRHLVGGDRTGIPDPVSCTAAYADPAGLSFRVAHEFGHAQFSFEDEYQSIHWPDDVGPYCGHTIMNGPDTSHTLCTSNDHCFDPGYSHDSARFYTPVHSCASGSDNWSLLAASGKVPSWVFPLSGQLPDQWDSLRTNAEFHQVGVIVSP